MERRRARRFNIDAFIRIKGINRNGNAAEEETFTLNISSVGAYFISNIDYDPNKKVECMIEIPFTLGENEIQAGKWMVKATIVRMDNIVKDDSGKLKKQNIAINFDQPLGQSAAKSDAWSQVID